MKNQFSLKLDLGETGLDMFFKPYHQKAFEVLWDHPEGLNSRQVWNLTNMEMTDTISRASIINFLNDSVELGFLEYREESGKGGYRRVYWHKYDRDSLKTQLNIRVMESLKTLKNE